MEMQSDQIYDPTADVSFSSENTDKILAIPVSEEADVFDKQSQLSAEEFYKQKVNEMHNSGVLGNSLQISTATDEFIKSSKKDPVQLLNIFCSVSGEPNFPFHDYQLTGRPDKNKFIMVSEVDGQPIFGVLQPSKKEAKRACAVRIIDKLMSEQRLNCLSETGRKLKNPNKHPRPFPNPSSGLSLLEKEQMELANLGSEYYNQQQPPIDPQMASFAEDIDLDKQPKIPPNANQYREDFDKQNPVPKDCKDPAHFVRTREHAFRLFLENVFWNEVKFEQKVYEKLNQCGMWGEQWNALQFVNKCVMIANSWRKATNENQIPIAKEEPEMANPESPIMVVNQKMAVEEKEKEMEGQMPVSIEYFIFTLPYIPARYACLALFGGQVLYGQIADSKHKARLNCAFVLAAKMVELGWADLEKKPKKRVVPKQKKRKMEGSIESMEVENAVQIPSEHQFVFTIHPMEQLDARTHFLLATNPEKSALQLLNEIAGKQRYDIKYEESKKMGDANLGNSKFTIVVQVQPPGIPGMPRDFTGQPFCIQGIPEKNKKAAKLAAARATLDHFIKKGIISVNQQEFDAFKSTIKNIFEHCEEPIEVEEKQEQAENMQTGIEGLGQV